MVNKNVFINKETYDFLVKELGYEPVTLGIDNTLVNKQSIVRNEKEYLDLYYPIIEQKSN